MQQGTDGAGVFAAARPLKVFFFFQNFISFPINENALLRPVIKVN